MKPRPALVRILWLATLFLVLIAVAVVVRRTLQLFGPAPAGTGLPERTALNTGFSRNRLLTMVHIVPGLLFMLLAPLQFVSRLRRQGPDCPLDGARSHRFRDRHRQHRTRDEPSNGNWRRKRNGRNHGIRDTVSVCLAQGLPVDSPGRGSGTPRMDDPGVCDRVGSSHHAPHRRRFLRHSRHHASDASRVLRHGLLAWLHHAPDRRRELDQLHEAGSIDRRRQPSGCDLSRVSN